MQACAQSLGRGIGTGIKALERPADRPGVRLRLRSEKGFGLLELLMAMTILNVGILAIVAAFNSGALALSSYRQIEASFLMPGLRSIMSRATLRARRRRSSPILCL